MTKVAVFLQSLHHYLKGSLMSDTYLLLKINGLLFLDYSFKLQQIVYSTLPNISELSRVTNKVPVPILNRHLKSLSLQKWTTLFVHIQHFSNV